MEDLIERLKKYPDHQKRHIAFALSGGITVIVFVLWASVIFPHGTREIVAENNAQKVERVETPISTLKNGVAQAFEAVRGLWFDSKTSVEDLNLETEYEKIKKQVENGDIKFIPKSEESGSRF